MKRTLALGSVLTAAAVTVPAGTAAATMTELGATKTPLVAPTCPPKTTAVQCTIALTRVTALETVRDRIAYPTMVKKAGRIVAFTVGLSSLSGNRATRLSEIQFLDGKYGGTTRVAITVLRPVGAKSRHQWRVVAQSPMFRVQPYLGQVVEFPLVTTLPVSRGDTIALTTPTWAPVLSIDLSSTQFAYRQSRRGKCAKPAASLMAQLTIGSSSRYQCNYPGTRVEYTATEITNPRAPKNFVHSRRRRRVHARRR